MAVVFFEAKGLIFTNYMPRGIRVNVNYILGALGKFFKIFSQKKPLMTDQECFFYWDNAPVHSAGVV